VLRILSVLRRFRSRRLSATMLTLSTTALLAWIPAHLALVAVNDDGTILRTSLATADDRAVRDQVGGIVAAGGALIGSPAALRQVADVLRSSAPLSGAMSEAIVETWLLTRDRVMVQFERPEGTPAAPVTVPVGPLLSAAGLGFTRDDLRALPPLDQAAAGLEGTDLDMLFAEAGGEFGAVSIGEHGLELPLVTATQVAQLDTAHTWAVQIDRWGLVVAVLAGAVGVIATRRAWRALAILSGLVAVSAALAPLLLSLFGESLAGGSRGAGAALVAPALTAAPAVVGGWSGPVAVAAAVLAVVFLGLHRARGRRH